MVLCAQPPTPNPFPSANDRSPRVERGSTNDRTPPAVFPVQQVWTLALNNLLVAAPAYDNMRVFFPIEGDRIVAYDLLTGTQQWLISARPIVAPATGDDLLFVVEESTLTALHAGDGSAAWHVPFRAPAAAPVWDIGWLMATTEQGELLAFRAADGALIWKRDLGSPAHGRPALAGNRVYTPTTDGRIVALRVDTGEPVWERRIGGKPGDVLALDERIFVGSTDNFFYCLLAKDGEIDWRWRTGGDIVGSAVADESRVYFVALDNVLRALNQKSGGQQWMRPLSLRPAWGPVAAGSSIVVAGLSNVIRGFAMKDGAPAGDVTAAAEVASQPHAFTDPALHRPMLLVTARDIAKGGSAALNARSFEPPIAPVAPLPNLVQIAPLAPIGIATPRP